MMTKFKINQGFTLIELIAVITILSILTTVGVITYTKFAKQRYDTEAIANLSSLYEQTLVLVNEWGIGTASEGIPPGCLDIGPANAGKDGNAASGNKLKNNTKLNLSLNGVTHWGYRICIGYVKKSATEGVLVSAHREIDGNDRVLIMGSGIPEPVVAHEGGFGVVSPYAPPIDLATQPNQSTATMWKSKGNYVYECSSD